MANGKSQEEISTFLDLFLAEIRQSGLELMNLEGVLYEYHEGHWTAVGAGAKEKYEKMLYDLARREPFDYSTKHTALWRSLMSAVVADSKDVKFDARPLLCCLNGTLDLDTEELLGFDPKHYVRRRTNVAYDPDAKCPEFRAMFERIFEDKPAGEAKDLKKFLRDWMGLAVVGGHNFHRHMRRGLIIEGPSKTGKSTITAVLRELFGPQYVASPNMEQLGSQFGKETLVNAMALMTDDGVTEKMKGDPSMLKAIITGEQIQIDRKFKAPVMLSFDGPVLFTTNVLPRVDDESNALYNRFSLIEMSREFTEEDSTAHFGKGSSALAFLKEKGEMPGILNWCLDGFHRVKKRGHLNTPSCVVEAGTHFRRQNDPALDFIVGCTKRDKRTTNNTTTLVHAFCQFAIANHKKEISAKRAERLIDRTMREVYEDLKTTAEKSETGAGWVYPGIRLNEAGMVWLAQAKEKGAGKLIKSEAVNAATL